MILPVILLHPMIAAAGIESTDGKVQVAIVERSESIHSIGSEMESNGRASRQEITVEIPLRSFEKGVLNEKSKKSSAKIQCCMVARPFQEDIRISTIQALAGANEL